MIGRQSSPFLPGCWVEVKTWPEIRATLDRNGMYEALPFMPEMLPFCGRRFRVSKRLERTCEEIDGTMRRIRNVVFLEDLRCNGTDHAGCQKGCLIFWKEAWLRRVSRKSEPNSTIEPQPIDDYPFPCKASDDQYICQSTELVQATSYLSVFDIRSYIRDIRARTYSPLQLLRILSYAVFLRFRRVLTGRSHRFVAGCQSKTPRNVLNLQPGELVKVRTREEIASTLDKDGKNRGLAFTVEMLPFCGGTFRVLRRLERMIQESTHRIVTLQDTVILENVTCDGCHILRGGCPRANYHFWREAWLERVHSGAALSPASSAGDCEPQAALVK
jgi:hypothetical protein